MSFGHNTGEALPNADVPRLREYAKIMNYVSDYVELIETTKPAIDLESVFTISIENNPDIIIPTGITDTIGEVSYITARPKLASDTMHIDEDIAPYFDETPTIEMAYDSIYDEASTATNETIVRQASNISLDFYGPKGHYILSRTNLTDPTSDIQDHVTLYTTASKEPIPVAAVSKEELNQFLVSSISPFAVNQYSGRQFDITSPDMYPALSALFAMSGKHLSSESVRHFPGRENFFKHSQEYDPKTDRFKTSFKIRIESNGPDRRTIIATHSLETNFQLSFETITEGGDFTPQNLENAPEDQDDAPRIVPHTPTLDELQQLSTFLKQQVMQLSASADQTIVGFEVGEEDSIVDIDFTPIEEAYEFKEIVANDTRRDFAAMADIAITQELEQILSDTDDDQKDDI